MYQRDKYIPSHKQKELSHMIVLLRQHQTSRDKIYSQDKKDNMALILIFRFHPRVLTCAKTFFTYLDINAQWKYILVLVLVFSSSLLLR